MITVPVRFAVNPNTLAIVDVEKIICIELSKLKVNLPVVLLMVIVAVIVAVANFEISSVISLVAL